jgi:hypothetical protein
LDLQELTQVNIISLQFLQAGLDGILAELGVASGRIVGVSLDEAELGGQKDFLALAGTREPFAYGLLAVTVQAVQSA